MGKERLYWKKGFIERKALLKNSVKFKQNFESWLKLWKLVKIVKFYWNCETWLKLRKFVKIVKVVKILKGPPARSQSPESPKTSCVWILLESQLIGITNGLQRRSGRAFRRECSGLGEAVCTLGSCSPAIITMMIIIDHNDNDNWSQWWS